MSVIYPPGFKPAGQEPAPAPEPAAPVAPVAPAPEPPADPIAPADPVAPAAPAPAASPAPAPEPPLNPYEVASKGRFKTEEEFTGFLTSHEKLQAEYQAAQEKLQVDPFGGNALSKKFHELAASGASAAELSNFVQMQSLEVEKLQPLDAVRLSVKMQNPSWDDAMVDAYMSHNLNLKSFIEGDGTDTTPLDRVALDEATKKAVADLNGRKVKSEAPASFEAKQQQQQAFAARQNSVGTIVQSVAGAFGSMKIGDGDGAFDFPVDQAVVDFAKNAVINQLAQSNVPMDDNMAKSAREQMQAIIWASQGPKILTAAVKNAEARTREAVIKEQANANPAQVPSGKPPIPGAKTSGKMDPGNLLMPQGKVWRGIE